MTIASGGDSGKRGDGRIIFISPLVHPDTRSARVIAEIDNRLDLAPWRSRDSQHRDQGRVCGSPRSPRRRSRRSAASVWSSCGHPDGFQKRTVTIGRSDEQAVEITSGLSAGEQIAVKNTFLLKAELGKGDSRGRRLASEIIIMIARVLAFSVHQRWLVALLTLAAAAFGVWSMTRLPIDAVPDITNNQVQINTIAPALSPIDIEKQVTYPLETALAGIPGLEYTRSFSRNGFSQITAVFDDKIDIYFARQQINERLTEAKASLPPGAEPRMGPVSTGLGEIYMWTVHYKRPGEGATVEDGKPGWQSDGSYLTPEGERLNPDLERTAYLRTVQDWIIRPQLKTVPGVAGVDTIGGFQKQYHVQPDPAKLIGLDLSFGDLATAIESNNVNRGAGYLEDNGEAYVVRSTGRLESMQDIGNVVVATRGGVPVRVKDIAEVKIGRELRTGSASENGEEAVIGTAMMLIGGNSRSVSAMVDAKMKEVNRTLPPGIQPDGFEPHIPCGRYHKDGEQGSGRGRPPRHPRAFSVPCYRRPLVRSASSKYAVATTCGSPSPAR